MSFKKTSNMGVRISMMVTGKYITHHIAQLEIQKEMNKIYKRDINQFIGVFLKFHLITQVISTGSLPSCHPCNKSTRQWSCSRRKKASENINIII